MDHRAGKIIGGCVYSEEIAERAAELDREGWRQRDRDVFKTVSVWPPAPPPFVALQYYRKPRPRRLDDDGDERGVPALTFSEGTAGSERTNRRTSMSSNPDSARSAFPRDHNHSGQFPGQFPGVASSTSGVQMEWGRPTI